MSASRRDISRARITIFKIAFAIQYIVDINFLQSIGILGIAFIVFAESGLLVGFFLPGDSLLFSAGVLASQGYFNIWILLIASFLAAVIGDSVGYYIGKKSGKRIFNKQDSLFFHSDHLIRAKNFYEKHGGKTIIIARFTPIVRTFAPVVAGVGEMDYKKFLSYNIFGGLLWAVGITLLGYYLGNLFPDIDHYLEPILIGIIVITLAPTVYHLLKEEENRVAIFNQLKSQVKRFRKKKEA